MTFVINDYESITIAMMVTYIVQMLAPLRSRHYNKVSKKQTYLVYCNISHFPDTGRFITTTVPFIILMSLWQFTGILLRHWFPRSWRTSLVRPVDQRLKGGRVCLFHGRPVAQVGAVLGAAIAGYGMVVVGFDAAAPTPAGIAGMASLMTYASAGVSIISAILFILYPLTDKYLAKLRSESVVQEAAVQ